MSVHAAGAGAAAECRRSSRYADISSAGWDRPEFHRVNSGRPCVQRAVATGGPRRIVSTTEIASYSAKGDLGRRAERARGDGLALQGGRQRDRVPALLPWRECDGPEPVPARSKRRARELSVRCPRPGRRRLPQRDASVFHVVRLLGSGAGTFLRKSGTSREPGRGKGSDPASQRRAVGPPAEPAPHTFLHGVSAAVKTSSRSPRSITSCRRSVQTGRTMPPAAATPS